MGCGHSKINIYPRRARNKSNSKKSVTPEKTDSEDEDGVEGDLEQPENLEDCDQRKTIKVKPFGGPLLAQTEISSSQHDFFKMLDEKIENGPDYNSESETERAAEAARLNNLLKDWETASASSRSLPTTPKRRTKERMHSISRSADAARTAYPTPQSVIHQSYGVTQVPYRQVPTFVPTAPSYSLAGYQSAMQYQAISPMYTSQPTYQPPPRHQHPAYGPQHGSPIKAYSAGSPRYPPHAYAAAAAPKPTYGNGELQYYGHPTQYPHYKTARDQPPPLSAPPYRISPRNYQSSITIPMVVPGQQTDVLIARKHYELT